MRKEAENNSHRHEKEGHRSRPDPKTNNGVLFLPLSLASLNLVGGFAHTNRTGVMVVEASTPASKKAGSEEPKESSLANDQPIITTTIRELEP